LSKFSRNWSGSIPGAARSLAEGLEETLTIHRLGLSETLRKSFFSTNPIESALSVVDGKRDASNVGGKAI
jgi:transposase-like protein